MLQLRGLIKPEHPNFDGCLLSNLGWIRIHGSPHSPHSPHLSKPAGFGLAIEVEILDLLQSLIELCALETFKLTGVPLLSLVS